jgi:hypothetical protein
MYKICSCEKVYIGHTDHHISTRSSEHIRDTRLRHQQSAVAEHSIETKHGIEYNKAKVTANIHKYCPRIMREAIQIIKHPLKITCGKVGVTSFFPSLFLTVGT